MLVNLAGLTSLAMFCPFTVVFFQVKRSANILVVYTMHISDIIYFFKKINKFVSLKMRMREGFTFIRVVYLKRSSLVVFIR